MRNLFHHLKKLFEKSPLEASPKAIEPSMNDKMPPWSSPGNNDIEPILNENILKALMQQVEQTKEGMFTCEETFDLLDEYAELIDSDQDAAQLMPLVKAHLDMCPGCEQRFSILLNIISTSLDEA